MQKFTENMKEEIQKRLQDLCKVEVQTITKNNGTIHTGLACRPLSWEGDHMAFPVVYLEAMFRRYDGSNFNELADEIESSIRENVGTSFDTDVLLSYEKARPHICMKVLNHEWNEEALADIPHKQITDDLSAVCYMQVESMEGHSGTCVITGSVLEHWEIDQEKLFSDALSDSTEKFRPALHTIGSLLGGFMDPDEEAPQDLLYVLTNDEAVFGAGALAYPDIMDQACTDLDTERLVILPSSLHEVLLIRDTEGIDVHEMKNLVMAVNGSTVDPEDRLSDSVYTYRKDTRELTRVA